MGCEGQRGQEKWQAFGCFKGSFLPQVFFFKGFSLLGFFKGFSGAVRVFKFFDGFSGF